MDKAKLKLEENTRPGQVDNNKDELKKEHNLFNSIDKKEGTTDDVANEQLFKEASTERE